MICSTSSVPLYNIIRFIIYGITTTEVTELLISFLFSKTIHVMSLNVIQLYVHVPQRLLEDFNLI